MRRLLSALAPLLAFVVIVALAVIGYAYVTFCGGYHNPLC